MVSIDTLTELCDGTALNTGAAGTYNLGSIDLGSASPGDISVGNPLYFVISMKTDATSGGSATATFRVVTGTDSSPATTTLEILLQTSAFPVAEMTAGTVLLCVPLPAGTDSVPYLRHLALQQTTATAAFTGGTLDCYLTDKAPKQHHYPDGAPALA